MKLQELRKAAKECINILGFEELDAKANEKELLVALTEVASQIEDGTEDAIEIKELNDLSKPVKALLLELKNGPESEVEEEEVEEKPKKGKEKKADKKEKKEKAKKEVEPEEEDEDEEADEEEESDEDELIEQIKEADLDELKQIIKEEGAEVFPVAHKGIHLQKNAEKLRIKALKDLGEEVEEEEMEEKPKKEKAKKEPKEKKERSESSGDMVYRETVKNPKITVEKLMKLNEKLARPASEVTIKKYRGRVLLILDLIEKNKNGEI